MRRLLAATVVFAMLSFGVGVDATSASAPSAAPGVTKDDVKIGVSYVDLAAVRAAGINRDHGDYEKAYQTVIDEINAKGGVNGRKIVPVFAGIDPIGTDPAQQACVKLTEDEKVFAVIGQFQGRRTPLLRRAARDPDHWRRHHLREPGPSEGTVVHARPERGRPRARRRRARQGRCVQERQGRCRRGRSGEVEHRRRRGAGSEAKQDLAHRGDQQRADG